MTRCPRCGATNPADARWCNQCLAALVGAADTASARDAPPVRRRHEVRSSPDPPEPATEPTAWEHPDGFRRRGELIERRCARCDAYYDLALGRCPLCGAGLDAGPRPVVGGPGGEAAATQPPWSALLLSAVLPGAGHLAVGRYGTGLSRVLLAGLWSVGAVLLFGAGGAAALLGMAPLALGVVVLWSASLLELLAFARGQERVILTGRTLLWLVVGVTLATAGGMAVAALAALGR